MNNNQSSKNRKRMKFTYSYAIDITNERFESLVRRIFVQIDQFEIQDEGLYAVINEAKGHLPVLISLGQTSLANPNTEVMNEISEQCREEIIALRMMIDGSKRGGTESTRKAAKILSQWIKKDRSDLSTRGKIKQVTIGTFRKLSHFIHFLFCNALQDYFKTSFLMIIQKRGFLFSKFC